jgi:hypothetical protein
MVNTFDPNTSSVAKASIRAELDRFVENFGKSLQSCNEAAKLLMIGTAHECRQSNTLKLEQNCSMFRGVSVLADSSIRGKTSRIPRVHEALL